MIRIAIVDDADIICQTIEEFLISFSKKNGVSIDYDSYYSGEEIIHKLGQSYYDLIFLDIEIGVKNGIDVSKHLREVLKNETTEIIYVSSYRHYAVELFDYDPITFLSKPIEIEKMINAFTKFLKRLKINEEIFAFKKERELIRVPLKDILYFESSDHKIILHSKVEQYIFYDKMERLVALLEKQKFLYVHKSFFVNSKHIQKYEYETILVDDGTEIPIAQSRRKIIREWQLSNDIEETGWQF
ncbi:LytTR family DNA-binding domain-containing protein [uncultured Ruminococcus sp.]|uniref:LytR/AlgR family response regulator transcription factor n=1 Tax=uncultured Ruminococcus sp. TaxID=165186 RepID=UPI0025E4DED2|nr:LytTR family DNA-binding domain-containing protein [uncultured Ruminococcus sp.]